MLQTKEIDLNPDGYSKKALVYSDSDTAHKAAILYFHGGGLLYGDKSDLPDYHIERMTKAGYVIISFDYPLAPAAKLPIIMEDVCQSINLYLTHAEQYTEALLPYVLWGRSAGAYLCLIAAAHGNLKIKPAGILSYYGYGFLCDNWFHTPSRFYCSLPPVSEACLSAIPEDIHTTGDLETHYSVYVYARQKGCWKELIYEGRDKFFFLDYSLRTCDKLPCPLFCAHSMGDTDVPYEEFLALSSKYYAQRYIASCNEHDFDRNTELPATVSLLDASIEFLDRIVEAENGRRKNEQREN